MCHFVTKIIKYFIIFYKINIFLVFKVNYMLGINNNNSKIIDPKSIIISGEVHKLFKTYCKSKGIAISFITEKLYLKFLKEEGFIKDDEK